MRLKRIRKEYGGLNVLRDFSLELADTGAVCLFGYDGEQIGKGLRLDGKGIYFFVSFVSVQRDGNFEIFIHSVPFFAPARERPRRLVF